MAWWIEPLEIKGTERVFASQRFRLTARSDEDGGGPFALCECEGGHVSIEDAKNCPEAQNQARCFG